MMILTTTFTHYKGGKTFTYTNTYIYIYISVRDAYWTNKQLVDDSKVREGIPSTVFRLG